MRIENRIMDAGSRISQRWRAGSRFAPLRSPGADHGQEPREPKRVLFNFAVD